MKRTNGRADGGGRARLRRRGLPLCLLAATALTAAFADPSATATSRALWLRHVDGFGGLSVGARDAALRMRHSDFFDPPSHPGRSRSLGANVQMNDDSDPPTPQNQPTVAYDIFDPATAVAAATDYGSPGLVVMRTRDGGLHWISSRIGPIGSEGACFGQDPWVVFSRRDRAFYLAELCTSVNGAAELQLIKSIDGGKSWTPAGFGATAETNVDASTGDIDTSLFFDQVAVAVDNSPSSPHYGRIYLTYAKFHFLASGFSDYCPVQLAYTDRIPTDRPFDAEFSHTAVVPDDPRGSGKGASANQFAHPIVESDGTLDVSYVLEDCNTGKDRHLELQKSTDGGASFLRKPIRIDRPGEFVDNPHLRDKLPPTRFGAPISPSFAVNPRTGDLALAYMNAANEGSGTDISIQFSPDGGRQWTRARSLSVTKKGAPAPQDQFFPAISADPAGRWHAIWYDRRLDSDNVRIDTFQADWTATPTTFRNRRISTRSWNPNRAFFDCGCSIGDYNALASANSVVYPVWADGRHSAFTQTGIGETDIFSNIEKRS